MKKKRSKKIKRAPKDNAFHIELLTTPEGKKLFGSVRIKKNDASRREVLDTVRKIRANRTEPVIFVWGLENTISIAIAAAHGKLVVLFGRNPSLKAQIAIATVDRMIEQAAAVGNPKEVEAVRAAMYAGNLEELERLVDVEHAPLTHRHSRESLDDLMNIRGLDQDGYAQRMEELKSKGFNNPMLDQTRDQAVDEQIEKTAWSALDDVVMIDDPRVFDFVVSRVEAGPEELTELLKKVAARSSGPISHMVRVLLDAGGDPNAAFADACRSGDLERIKQLLFHESLILDEKQEDAVRAAVVHCPESKELFDNLGVDPAWTDPFASLY